MSPPSPNPTSIFRWEDSSALEHACWACPTKSNSPKAIQTCYGIHSIPCMAYHSTMHAIGTSHRCSGCTTSREMHESRHREIAELVADYHTTAIDLENPPKSRRALGECSTNLRFRDFGQTEEDQSDDERGSDENDENVFTHDTASTTASSENGSLSKLTRAEVRERKKAIKTHKSLKKAAKNEARHAVQITMEDVKRIGTILHGDGADREITETHPLATDKTIEDVIARNLGFVKQIQCHKKALHETIRIGRREETERRRSRRRTNEGLGDYETEAVIDAVLIKLGVDVTAELTVKKSRPVARGSVTPSKHDHKKNSNNKAKVVARLREAVRDDLEKHENDLRQTYIRAGGFFRYAGKAVFERMTAIAMKIDLQTGEEWDKKRKREAKVGLIDSKADVTGDGV